VFGAFDIDSLHFETRLLIRKLRELTGENERDAVHLALADRFQRLADPQLAKYCARTVTVQLLPDVARHFPDSASVNQGRRELLRHRGIR